MATPQHLRSSAVDQGIETGDRLDKLERSARNAVSTSTSAGTSVLTWTDQELASGVAVSLGSVDVPAGASKVTIGFSYTPTDEEDFVTSVQVDVVGAGQPTGGGAIGSVSHLTVGVLSLSLPVRGEVVVSITTDGGSPVSSAGCVIVEPIAPVG